MSDSIRVYVNGQGVDVPPGSTALDCVRALDAGEAEAVSAGRRAITDSRGLETEPSRAAFAGAIYRTVSARRNRGGEESADA